MKSLINCRLLSLFVIGFVTTFSLKAQSDSMNYKLSEVTVSGSRVPLELGKTARIVTIIDSKTIAALPVKTINDLLKYTVGVEVRQRGVYGAQTDIGIRGGTQDQIAILLNGINMSDPQTGHNAFNLPVDLSDIQRIEVLEGPASRVYGVSSLVGAINIVTKKDKQSSQNARFEYGAYNYLNGGTRLSFSNSNAFFSISEGIMETDGYSHNAKGGLNSDIHQYRIFAQSGYDSEKFKVLAQAGYLYKDFGANTFYTPKFDDQFENVQKALISVSAETKGIVHFKPSIYWNNSRDRFELFRGKPNLYPFNYNNTNVYGLNLGSWVHTFLGKTALSFELRQESLESTNLGEALKKPVRDRRLSLDYTKGLNRTNIGIYLEHNIVLNNFTLSGGVATIKNTGNKEGFKFYPGLDASFRFLNHWKVYTSFNSSFRMPTFTELYYNSKNHIADKYLKSEKMYSSEIGLKYLRPGVTAVLSVYYQEGRDMIDWILDKNKSKDNDIWMSVNITKIHTLGQELNIIVEPLLLFGENFNWWKSFTFSYAHISQDKKLPKNIQSQYALTYLRNKLVAQTLFSIKNMDLSLSYRFVDRVGRYTNKEGQIKANVPYSLVDAKMCWNINHIKLYQEVSNVFNVKYFDYGNIPQPGIILRIGMAVNF